MAKSNWKHFPKGLYNSISSCLADLAKLRLISQKSNKWWKKPSLQLFWFFFSLISGFTSVAEVATVLAKVFMCASILMLVALTWERHFAICSPHQYRIHIRTTPRWRHLCRYFIPVMLCSILFNIPTFINIEVCPALALLHFLYTILKKSKISKKVLLTFKNNAFPCQLGN